MRRSLGIRSQKPDRNGQDFADNAHRPSKSLRSLRLGFPGIGKLCDLADPFKKTGVGLSPGFSRKAAGASSLHFFQPTFLILGLTLVVLGEPEEGPLRRLRRIF